MAVQKKDVATQALIDQAVQDALTQAKAGLVTAASKPDQIAALRKTWRSTYEHKKAQVVRLISATLGVFALQVGGDVAAHKDPFAALHNGRDLLFYIAPVVFVAWRQIHPAMTAAQADSAPGVTIVPDQVGVPTVDVPVDNAQVEVAVPVALEGDAAP